MTTVNDTPRNFNEMLRLMGRRLTALERRRSGDGVNVDGQCTFGGGVGGDVSYYGGGTGFPTGSFPPGAWASGGGGGGGSTYSAGANIDIVSNVINFEVVFTEPTTPRAGQLWFDASA